MGYPEIKKHYLEHFGDGSCLIEFPDEDIIITLETGNGILEDSIFEDEQYGWWINAIENRLVIIYSPKK